MKNLKPLDSAYSYFESITEAKHSPIKTTLNRLKPQIQNHYVNYEKLCKTDKLHTITSANYINRNRTALLSCYNVKTAALNQLKSDISLNQTLVGQSYCQYCMVRTPDTFDHYVPKDEYCEYAVLSLNLIPCCDSCNRIKSNIWINSKNRIYLNLYYDKFLKYKILFCKITYKSDIPLVKFSLKKNKSLSVKQNKILFNHYKKLKLLELFKMRTNVVISETMISIQSNPQGFTRNEKITFIKNEAKNLKDQYGINYWKALIIDELANNNDFLNSI